MAVDIISSVEWVQASGELLLHVFSLSILCVQPKRLFYTMKFE